MALIRFPESVNSPMATVGSAGSINYGGSSSMTAPNGAGPTTYIMGGGDDTYIIPSGYGLNIDDAGNGNDTLVATGISFNTANFYNVNGKHLVIIDSSTNTFTTICNWQTEESRIESFQFKEGTYSYAQMVTKMTGAAAVTFASLNGLPAGATDADLEEAIAYYHQRGVNLTNTGSLDAGVVNGTESADNLSGSGIADTMSGAGGNDTMIGFDGNDSMNGNQGNDSVLGGNGDDTVYGGQGDDYVGGNGGNDIVGGNLGNDQVFGGQGNDTCNGGQNDDVVGGNLGDDFCYGDLGNDSVFGGQGNDQVFGGDGNDLLSGDLGNDTYTGGAGADIFAFAASSGSDVITDWQTGVDKIQVTQAMVTAGITFVEGNLIFSAGNQVLVTGMTSFSASTDLVIVG